MLDDVDLEAMRRRLFGAAFANSGQVCMAIKRLYVHERIYEHFCDSVRDSAQGDASVTASSPTQFGPIQNRMQYDQVLDILEDSRQRGGHILAGGDRSQARATSSRRPSSPTSRGCAPGRRGAVRTVAAGAQFSDVEEAIRRQRHALRALPPRCGRRDIEGAPVAARMEAGTVWVNHHRATAPNVPFGGIKESGLGREHGVMGVQSYMEAQVINLPVAAAA